MKKNILFFTLFALILLIFCESIVFASDVKVEDDTETPFFLQNWIIPEDAAWGKVYRLPPRKGLYQTEGNTKGFDFVNIEQGIEMPMYFLQNNIADWNMTYSQILQSVSGQKEFAVYTKPYFKQRKNKFLYSTSIVAVYKDDPKFRVEWGFAWQESETDKLSLKPLNFSIHYKENFWPLPVEGMDAGNVIVWKPAKNMTFSKMEKEAIDFYYKVYSGVWVLRPELEQYAIALSFVLFMMNNQFPLDYTGRTKLNDNYVEPAEILRDSWNITNGTSLRNKLYDLEGYGHSGAFNKMCKLLDKYPGKSPFEIGNLEYLSISDMTRLLYVRDNRKAAGCHGIEAWDEGRMITLIRWGLGCGYIDLDEANRLIEPIVERVKKNYSSMAEYFNHYLLGRGFNFLYNGSHNDAIGNAAAYSLFAEAFIPLEHIKFSGENADKKAAGKYKESKELKKWAELQRLCNEELTEENFQKLNAYEKEYSAYPNLFIWPNFIMLAKNGSFQEVADYIEKYYDFFEAHKEDEDVYPRAMLLYLIALNELSRQDEALAVFEKLPVYVKQYSNIVYQYAYANYLMLGFCSTQEEYDSYKAKAKRTFLSLKEYGRLDPEIEEWLKEEN